jgi:hypothetical protein
MPLEALMLSAPNAGVMKAGTGGRSAADAEDCRQVQVSSFLQNPAARL